MKRFFICFFFILTFEAYAQNKGFFVDIGSGWLFDITEGLGQRGGALAPLTLTASYFTSFGLGVTVAYGRYIFGDKNRPDNGQGLFVAFDYSIPLKAADMDARFPVNHSFSTIF